MNPDECEFLHEGFCIVHLEYPEFVCIHREQVDPDSMFYVCKAKPVDLLTED